MRRSRAKGKRPGRLEDLPLADVTWEAEAFSLAALVEREAHGLPESVVVLALEAESGVVVCSEALADATPSGVAQILAHACSRPHAGPPRRPKRIIVRDEQVVAALRAVFRPAP